MNSQLDNLRRGYFTARDALHIEQEIIRAALALYRLKPQFSSRSEVLIDAWNELSLWTGNLVTLHEQVAETDVQSLNSTLKSDKKD